MLRRTESRVHGVEVELNDLAAEAETEAIAARVYNYVWQRSASGDDLAVT